MAPVNAFTRIPFAVYAGVALHWAIRRHVAGSDRPVRARIHTPDTMTRSIHSATAAAFALALSLATAPFLAALTPAWKQVWTIDPSRSSNGESPEAFLPTEMDFPLSALWRVDRPGPWISLYQLPNN